MQEIQNRSPRLVGLIFLSRQQLILGCTKALSEEVSKLNSDQDIMKPLLDFGAEVRLSFLEQTKKTLWSTAPADFALAHRGYFEGNASMEGVRKIE